MSAGCCAPPPRPMPGHDARRFRRVLWVVLAINAAMFAVEIAAGLAAGSVSLQADALDFPGAAGHYAISLLVVGSAAPVRARAARGTGATRGLFGIRVVAAPAWQPSPGPMPHGSPVGGGGAA